MDDDYRAAPLSRDDICEVANRLRAALGFSERPALPIVKVLEYGLPQLIDGFNYEIVADDELPGREAETYPAGCEIVLSQSTYRKACRGDHHSRFTLAHEMGHLFLHTPRTISLAHGEDSLASPRTYEKPGWQADAFAAELLAPVSLIREMGVDEISRLFIVSRIVAERQFDRASSRFWFGHREDREPLLPGFEMPRQSWSHLRKGAFS